MTFQRTKHLDCLGALKRHLIGEETSSIRRGNVFDGSNWPDNCKQAHHLIKSVPALCPATSPYRPGNLFNGISWLARTKPDILEQNMTWRNVI